jgi:hypothetical protein
MKNMRNAVNILLLSWICMASTCNKEESENCHLSITFVNNSDITLYVKDDAFYLVDYPNPFDISKRSYFDSWQKNIKSQEVNKDAISSPSMCIEHFFDDDLQLLYVYIFDAAIVENTPWEVVARDYLVLKRYDVTLADLQRLDWNISYPPDERMKDIKQYPPYGSE